MCLSDPCWFAHDPAPWPAWVEGFRPHQVQAVREIMDAYERGADVVLLDAPTGAGKTLIGEMVRRLVGGNALYVCHSLGLQDQFVTDFPGSAVLKGRANYPTQNEPYPDVTAEDCTKDGPTDDECMWCDHVDGCEYTLARAAAHDANLAVVNTAYFLTEANGPGNLSGRRFVIIDEADTLEQILMGRVEFRVGASAARKMHLDIPKKGVHMPTIAAWLRNKLKPAITQRVKKLSGDDIQVMREKRRLQAMVARCETVAGEILGDGWVRDYDGPGSLILKPVVVSEFGQGKVWRHAEKYLLMSATLISTAEVIESLGMGDLHVETVHVPMTFPVENRTVYGVPVARMTAKMYEDELPKLVKAIEGVLARHPGDRVLVHTVSYKLAADLVMNVETGERSVFTYSKGSDREEAVRRFKGSAGGVLFAPSVDRGFDFKGDEARVVVVAKIPYPYLGDAQVSARLRVPGGQEWYTVQTIRSLVQMTGRGVRSKTDWAVGYVLDATFMDLWRKNRRLLPGWWKEAVDMSLPPRELVEGPR